MTPRLLTSIIVTVALLAACGEPQQASTPTATPRSKEEVQTAPANDVPDINVSSILVTRASFPVALAFAPDGRLFYNEFSTGDIRIFTDGEASTFAHVEIFSLGECGLLGLAIDPEFEENHYVYVYFIEPVESRDDIGHPVIMRFTEVDGRGQDPTVLVQDLPNTNPVVCGHVAGNLNFGPDGYLYVSIGEMEFKDPAQDLGSPLGKILRIDKRDGSAAPDNPFVNEPGADPRVFAYGFRNPFDFAFDPESGRIYETENGPSNCDELNIVEAGNNYGHPLSSLEAEEPPCFERFGVRPIYLYSIPDKRPEVFSSNVAPAGAHFVSGDVYPSLGDALLTCEWNTGFMRRILLVGPSHDQVIDDSIVVEDCRLDIATDIQGLIYYSNPGEIRLLLPSSKKEGQ